MCPGSFLSVPISALSKDDKPSILGLNLPSAWNLYIKYSARAGERYTPYSMEIDSFQQVHFVSSGETNSAKGPYQSWLNLSFQKYFDVGKYKLTLYFEAENILDHKNVTIINPLTGEEYKEGDIIATGDNFFEVAPEGYRLPLWDNPSQFLNPRTFKLGLGISF